MTLEQFEYIIAVHQEGTISAAAQKLNISHPSICRAISSLEAELGINIFLRSRNGSEVTEQGRAVLQSAEKILNEVDRMRALAGEGSKPRTLVVKAFPVDSMFFIPDVIAAMKNLHRHVTVSLANANVSEVINDLRAQKIDFGIVLLPRSERGVLGTELKQKLLFESQFVIACSGQSELAQRELLSAEDIRKYPFVLHTDPLILRSLRQIFADTGFPKVLSYSNDNSLIKQMVASGQALSVYTKHLEKADPRVAKGEIVLKPFACNMHLNQCDFLCVYNAKKQLSSVESDFLRQLTEITARQV